MKLPSPTGGLNYLTAENRQAPTDARVLDNWIPDTGFCRIRESGIEAADIGEVFGDLTESRLASFGWHGQTESPITVTMTEQQSFPLGSTLLILAQAREVTTLATAELTSLSVDGQSATQFWRGQNDFGGQVNALMWRHIWTGWHIINYTGGTQVNEVQFTWNEIEGFTNGGCIFVLAVPTRGGADFDGLLNGFREEVGVVTMGDETRDRFQITVSNTTDNTFTTAGSITAVTNTEAVVTDVHGLTPPNTQTWYSAVYSPNGSTSNIETEIPGAETGSSTASIWVNYP